jgi:hypothetical protein
MTIHSNTDHGIKAENSGLPRTTKNEDLNRDTVGLRPKSRKSVKKPSAGDNNKAAAAGRTGEKSETSTEPPESMEYMGATEESDPQATGPREKE